MPKKMTRIDEVEMKGAFQFIKTSGYTFADWAEALETTPPTLRKWIREGSMPMMKAHTMAQKLEVTVDALYKPLLENRPFL